MFGQAGVPAQRMHTDTLGNNSQKTSPRTPNAASAVGSKAHRFKTVKSAKSILQHASQGSNSMKNQNEHFAIQTFETKSSKEKIQLPGQNSFKSINNILSCKISSKTKTKSQHQHEELIDESSCQQIEETKQPRTQGE
jgi:hypothetical protein